ncbi:DUF4142 domain-containing protein [Flavobacterium pallidum]|uniref:DUF4142 domain-containing protein n=1 Tax=Flavobacterium pallidum TaxID=2172098 RepID=A0A2S1SEQ3_9FLAO|nr:DUF4142 domain-containing protein [Flavobacterium pallidum]AWI24832.1 hypothetical protein HYN49_02405 [Flavobacterium pallidum]
MKKILLFSLILLSYYSKAQQEPADDAPIFIIQMANARLMDKEEGRLAAGYGTTQEIRDYGNRMVKEQEMLYAELQKLAASKNITLPGVISEKKSKALQKLGELRGNKFDKKFLRMIKIDHKRDVKRFKKATEFDDKATKTFAEKYLPMIQNHLDDVKKIIG